MPKARFDACGLKPDSKSSHEGDQALLSRTCGTGGPAFDVGEVSELFTAVDSTNGESRALAGRPLVPLSYSAMLPPREDSNLRPTLSRQSRDLSPLVFRCPDSEAEIRLPLSLCGGQVPGGTFECG